MKRILEVCLIASLSTVATFAAAQSSPEIPTLRPGIHVEMAGTRTARPVPDADQNDAFVLTVTDRGIVYDGTNAVDPSELTREIGNRMAARQQQLYIKADGRTPYASVSQVLKAAQASGIASPILLTAQRGVPAVPGALTSPQGVDVSIGSDFPSGTVATVVEFLPGRGQQRLVKVSNDEIAASTLTDTLGQHFRKGDDKVVLLKASLQLPFAEVVGAIDSCRAAGARVFLSGE